MWRPRVGRPGLTQHRKFRRLARALGSPLVARGALELLWEGCYEAGDDYVGTAEDIEHAIGWTGEIGALTSALRDAGEPDGTAGFIEPSSPGESCRLTYRVHDLWHHAPDYVRRRREREDSRRAKQPPVRHLTVTDRQASVNDGHVSVTEHVNPTHESGLDFPPHSQLPSPISQHPSPITRTDSLEPDGSAPTAAILTYPIIGKGPKTWALTTAHVAELQADYPALDIVAEARAAHAWVVASPERRKTGRGMPRFLAGWLNRSVSRGGQGGRQGGGEKAAVRAAGASGEWLCPHETECSQPRHCRHRLSNTGLYLLAIDGDTLTIKTDVSAVCGACRTPVDGRVPTLGRDHRVRCARCLRAGFGIDLDALEVGEEYSLSQTRTVWP